MAAPPRKWGVSNRLFNFSLILLVCLLSACSFARAEVAEGPADDLDAAAAAAAKAAADAAAEEAAREAAAAVAAAAAGAAESAANVNAEAAVEGGVAAGLLPLKEAEAEVQNWVCRRKSELYFLIANPISGSRLGAKYITSLPMVRARHGCADVRVFSQVEPSSLSLGIQQIDRAVKTLKTFYAHEHGEQALAAMSSDPSAVPLKLRIRVVTVGGDGGFGWLVVALFKANVDMNWVAAGIIPSGTGNDMAHSYGWTKARFPASNPLGAENIGKLLRTLQTSDLALHDMWRVVVKTDPVKGRFEAYKPDKGRVVTLGKDRNGDAKMKTFDMNIYFGLGFDGLVGIAFEQLRGRSRLWNRAMYGLNFLRYIGTSPFVCDSIDTLYTLNPDLVALLSNNQQFDKVPGLLPCVSLTFLNSKTIIGGLDLWGTSSKLGLRPPRDKRVMSAYNAFTKQLSHSRMDSGDGYIEVYTMAKTLDYARAQALRHNAIGRVMQAPGPFLLTFKEPVPFMPMQVDGEFFVAHGLSSISIRRARAYSVLRFRDPTQPRLG
ncbi:hypothetical protein Efla_007530 [Eimeria flavescens]